MTHPKSTLKDLRLIFERTITVRSIAEPFVSFDDTQAVAPIRHLMEDKRYDVIGVRQHGLVCGYVDFHDLRSGILLEHLRRFREEEIVDESSSLLQIFTSLRGSPRLFVSISNHVWGIVTKGDLQKAPIRMWLFGLLYILEMQFLRLIRGYYRDGSWREHLSAGRLDKAERLFSDRKSLNEEIDLADCLEFADKKEIVVATDELRSAFGWSSKSAGLGLLDDLRGLRDDLAHAQDYLAGRWPQVVDLAQAAERLLEVSESHATPADRSAG